MTALTEQEGGWVAELASRLRLIQADTAESSPEQRREYLREEVERNLKSLAPANRKRHVEALIARFPVGGQDVAGVSSPPPTPQVPSPIPETPEQIMERFLVSVKGLPEERVFEMGRRLSEAGLELVDRDSLLLVISDEQGKALGLPVGQQPNLRRMVELTVQLVKMLQDMERTALGSLRDISPKSAQLKRTQDFRQAAARFLTNENESLDPVMREMKSLLGGLMGAVHQGCKDFGREYVGRLSPSAIEDVVIGEGKGGLLFGPSKQQLFWDKYSDLAKDYATADLVERRIKDCLARFLETKVSGGR